uniref:Uncharacterized protein n=1 Tax=Rhizophora mucronata TaxID=61149 RepID=A0A2P2Q9K0_RHIMU
MRNHKIIIFFFLNQEPKQSIQFQTPEKKLRTLFS